MHMMWGVPSEEYVVDPVIESALNKLLHPPRRPRAKLLNFNRAGCWTFSANRFSFCIAVLWGPLNGGANQAVIEMLEAIRAEGTPLQSWIDRAKDKRTASV